MLNKISLANQLIKKIISLRINIVVIELLIATSKATSCVMNKEQNRSSSATGCSCSCFATSKASLLCLQDQPQQTIISSCSLL
jgi:hypothetical protein